MRPAPPGTARSIRGGVFAAAMRLRPLAIPVRLPADRLHLAKEMHRVRLRTSPAPMPCAGEMHFSGQGRPPDGIGKGPRRYLS